MNATSPGAPPGSVRFLSGWRLMALAVLVTTAIGLLLFAYHYLDVFARARTEPYHQKLIEELSSAYGVIIIVPLIAMVSRRLRAVRWPLALVGHVVAAVLLSAVATSWRWATREGLYRVFGLGDYDYGIMPLRYLMELPNDIIWYTVFVVFVLFFDQFRQSQVREMQLARTEAELSRVRLEALESRLHPHFLFNALHTVSSVMYEDVARADAMLASLSDLLRRTLRIDAREVSLREELHLARLWADIMQARFGDRLVVEVEMTDDAEQGMVPPLLLQPLLENAIKHSDGSPEAQTRITVHAQREHSNGDSGKLVVEVRDNGPGLNTSSDDVLTRGVGLSTTHRRLEAMYGGAAQLHLNNHREGGLAVIVSIPYRTTPND